MDENNDSTEQLGNAGNNQLRKAEAYVKGKGLRGLLGFETLYYPSVARVLWILALALIALVVVVMILAQFIQGVGAGIVGLIIFPIIGIIYAIITRVGFEFMVVLFKINDGIQEMNRKMK